MSGLIITFICALFFLLSGKLIQFIKRIFYIIATIILKFLNILGLKIDKRKNKIKTSKKFKETFLDINIVQKSKDNVKVKPSINLIALIMFILSLFFILLNLEVISGNIISKWFYNLDFNKDGVPLANIFYIKSQKDMDIVFTAIIFSAVSFSFSKLVNQWKETSKFRKAKKEMKLKQAAINLMTSKELLDAAKNKDNEYYNKLKK